MLALYISEVLGAQGSLVSSVTTPNPISFPDLTFSDDLETNIFIVDGSGSYSTASGADGSTVTLSIGELDIAVWSNSNWTRITNGWSGTLSPDGNALYALFQGRDDMVLKVQVKVVDSVGNSRTYLSMPVRVLNSMAPAGAIASMKDGQFAIPNGVDSFTVSGLGLQAVPRRVLPVGIRKPAAGAEMLFGNVVTTSITANGFTVELNGETDADGYIFDYLLIFG